jgi:hypothetical protein
VIRLTKERAWESYYKSREDAETKNVTERQDDVMNDGKPVIDATTGKMLKATFKTMSVSKSGQSGGAQYLQIIVVCNQQIANLLGLNAPTRSEISGPDGGPVSIKAETEALEHAKAIMADEAWQVNKERARLEVTEELQRQMSEQTKEE